MEKIMIITDPATEETFAIATEEDGSLRLFGVDEAGKDWADWVDQQTKGRGTLDSIIRTVGYAMRIDGPKPLTRQLRASLSDVLPKVREDVRLELVEGRVQASQEKSLPIAPSTTYLADDLVKSISRQPISASGRANHQNVVNYKAKAFFVDTYHASIAFEVKKARAVWDPNLGPSGGWRCPEGTRFGGYITDEWGRNCGLGVTRRIVNAITSVGQGLANFNERRGERRKPEGLGPSLRETAREGAEAADQELEAPSAEEQTPTVEDLDMELVDIEAGTPEARRERRRRGRERRRQMADAQRERRLSSRAGRFMETLNDVLTYGEFVSDEERERRITEDRDRRDRFFDAAIERRMRDLADQLDMGWGRDEERDRNEDEESRPSRPRRSARPRRVSTDQEREDREYPRRPKKRTIRDRQGRRWIWETTPGTVGSGRWIPDRTDNSWDSVPPGSEPWHPDVDRRKFSRSREEVSPGGGRSPRGERSLEDLEPPRLDLDEPLPPRRGDLGDLDFYGPIEEDYVDDPPAQRRVRQAREYTERIYADRRANDERQIAEATDGTLAARIRDGQIAPAVEGDIESDEVIDQSVDLSLVALRDRLYQHLDRIASNIEAEGGVAAFLNRSGSIEERLSAARTLSDFTEGQRRLARVDAILESRGLSSRDVPSNVTLGAMFDPGRENNWRHTRGISVATQRGRFEALKLIDNDDLASLDEFIAGLDRQIRSIDREVEKPGELWPEKVSKQVLRNQLAAILDDAKRHRVARAALLRPASAQETIAGAEVGDDGLTSAERVDLDKLRRRERSYFSGLLAEVRDDADGVTLPFIQLHTNQQDLLNNLADANMPREGEGSAAEGAKWRIMAEEHQKFLDEIRDIYEQRQAAPEVVVTAPKLEDIPLQNDIDAVIAGGDMEAIAEALSKPTEAIMLHLSAEPDPDRAARMRDAILADLDELKHAVEEYAQSDTKATTRFRENLNYHRETANQALAYASIAEESERPSLEAQLEFHEEMIRRYQAFIGMHESAVTGAETDAGDISAERPKLSPRTLSDEDQQLFDELATAYTDRAEEEQQGLEDQVYASVARLRERGADRPEQNALLMLLESADNKDRKAFLYEYAAERVASGTMGSGERRTILTRTLAFAQIPEDVNDDVLINWLLHAAEVNRNNARRTVEQASPYLGQVEMTAAEVISARAKFNKRYYDQARRRRNLLRSYLNARWGDQTPWRLQADIVSVLGDSDPDEGIDPAIVDFVEKAFLLEEFEGRDGYFFKTTIDTPSLDWDRDVTVQGSIWGRGGPDGYDWQVIGNFTRTLHRDGSISNNSMAINAPEFKNAGFQGVFNPHVWLWASEAGFDRVDVSAASDGPYVWGRVGFRGGIYFDEMRDRLLEALDEYDNGDTDGLIRTFRDAQMVRYLLALAKMQGDDDSNGIGLPEFIVATSDYSGLSGWERKERERYIYNWWKLNVPFGSGEVLLGDEYHRTMYGDY